MASACGARGTCPQATRRSSPAVSSHSRPRLLCSAGRCAARALAERLAAAKLGRELRKGDKMRPRSIIHFERIILLGLALWVVDCWLGWDQITAAASGEGDLAFVLAILALSFSL